MEKNLTSEYENRSNSCGSLKSHPNQGQAVNYYHKPLHLGCCSSPRSASVNHKRLLAKLKVHGFERAAPKLMQNFITDRYRKVNNFYSL